MRYLFTSCLGGMTEYFWAEMPSFAGVGELDLSGDPFMVTGMVAGNRDDGGLDTPGFALPLAMANDEKYCTKLCGFERGGYVLAFSGV